MEKQKESEQKLHIWIEMLLNLNSLFREWKVLDINTIIYNETQLKTHHIYIPNAAHNQLNLKTKYSIPCRLYTKKRCRIGIFDRKITKSILWKLLVIWVGIRFINDGLIKTLSWECVEIIQ